MGDQKEVVTTITKLDGSQLEVTASTGESLKTVLQKAGEYKPEQYSYMLSGPGIEGGQKQVDEAILDDVRVEASEQVLIIPKTIAG